IACGSAYEHHILVGRFDSLGNEIEGAANLVGTDGRQVLALEPNLRTVFPRQVIVKLQRRFWKQRAHCLFGLGYGFDEGGHYWTFCISNGILPIATWL